MRIAARRPGIAVVPTAPSAAARRVLAVCALIGPAFAWLVLFFAVPLAALVTISFYRSGVAGAMIPAFTFENYRHFLTDPLSLRVLRSTLVLGGEVTAWCLLLGFPLAYSLARTRSRGTRGAMVVMLLVPLMTSVVVRSYGWTVLLAGNGPLNAALVHLGVVRQPVQLLYTLKGTAVALVEVLLPFMVLSLMPVIQNIDRSLEQAAQSLGANGGRTFSDIVLPLSLPGVAAGSLLVFALTIAAFATPALVGGAKILLISLYVYQQALTLFNWPFGAAISFVLLVLVLALMIVQTILLERRKHWGPLR
jgi:putative spermidine/putrescine transport system permease protein